MIRSRCKEWRHIFKRVSTGSYGKRGKYESSLLVLRMLLNICRCDRDEEGSILF